MQQQENSSSDLQIEFLPAFADFIHTSRLEEFTDRYLSAAYELRVPLLRYFESLGKAEIRRIAQEGVVRMLEGLASERWDEYVETTLSNWVNNRLPAIDRSDVVVEDISLVNYARKQAFRAIIRDYTADHEYALAILDEIDRFLLFLERTMFKTFLEIQESKLKDANKTLQRREAELLEAQSLGRIGSFEWDLTGQGNSKYTPEVFKIFEFERTTSLENFIEDVHPEDRQRVRGAIERAYHEGLYECEYRYTRNNKTKILSSRGKVFFEEGKPVRMVGTITDITEKALLINRLQESEELNKQSQALTNTGNWKWTVADGNIEWSDEMYRIYGLQPQSEVITFERFIAFIHPDDRERRISEIKEGLNTGKVSDYVMKIVAAGGTEKVLKGKGQILRDKDDTAIGMLGTCQDITKEFRLSAELVKKNQQLVRKNQDLESFSFIASHDMQEPLRKIQFYSNRIANEGEGQVSDQLKTYVQKIAHASAGMQKIFEDFLEFYHISNKNGPAREVDVEQMVAEIAREKCSAFNALTSALSVESLPAVSGEPEQLRNLFSHLIDNAVKFRSPARPLQVIVSGSVEQIEDKPYALISVRDNGIGFDEKHRERIFELFQRLHSREEHPGSGIGLTLCKRIAEDHGGWINARSSPGEGSTFEVYLPVSL